jgi:outer membrane receptor for ferrienterochelin and colicin
LRIVGGIRADHDSRFDAMPISPRVAISYDLSSSLTAKYAFSMAYVAPSAYFYYSTWENHGQVSIPNPDIKPETSLTNEVNLIFRKQRMYASTSAFVNKSSNLILPSEGLEGPNIVRSTVWVGNDPSRLTAKPLTQSVNDGSSLVYGGELSVKYAVWKLQGWGSYSFVGQRREIEGQTTGLQQISAHNFRLGLTYAISTNLLITGAFVGRSRPANLAMGPEVDAHFVDQTRFPWEINLYALYTPWPRYDVFLNVRNLTNNRYALKAIYSEETGNAMVKEGIMAWAGLRYTYGL